MTRKIITFLGKYPKKTQYQHQGKTYTGQVFAEALRQFVDFDEMLVFVTEEARKFAWPVLMALQDARIKPVEIEVGATTTEMWGMFDELLARVNENDVLVFDITHGLRSSPFLVFLFAAFLKFARGVTIEAVYYGAYELGDAKAGVPAPVIELTEFVTMLDWITATHGFVEYGVGTPLAELLKAKMPPGLTMRDDMDARALGQSLRSASRAVEAISTALQVDRPIEAMQAAFDLQDTLRQARPLVSQQARPFEALTGKMLAQYGQFALDEPAHTSQLVENLWHQLNMVHWYLLRDQTVQAALLAREWLVSALAHAFAKPFLERDARRMVEHALNNAVMIRKGTPPAKPSKHAARLAALSKVDEIVKLWSQLTEIRNDIAHVGMRENALPALRLRSKVEKFYPELVKVARELLPKRA